MVEGDSSPEAQIIYSFAEHTREPRYFDGISNDPTSLGPDTFVVDYKDMDKYQARTAYQNIRI